MKTAPMSNCNPRMQISKYLRDTMNSQRQTFFTKTFFPAKTFIETNNIFSIRGKQPFLFHSVRANKQHTPCQKPYSTKQILTGVQDQTLF